MFARRWWWMVVLAMGCQSPETKIPESPVPRPLPPTTTPREGRGLLQSGAMQLGSGVGRNGWGWQGDGLSGF
jgi:hypothetical protein